MTRASRQKFSIPAVIDILPANSLAVNVLNSEPAAITVALERVAHDKLRVE